MALHPPSNDYLPAIALCAGVGGLELGLHIAEPGYRSVCYVEREAFAAATLVARMADKALDQAPVWSDIASFDGRPWRGKVRLVAGGYPCQPFSSAGRRLGEKDPRHLWPDVRRIVGEVRPEWCLFENVEGHMLLGAFNVIKDLRNLGYSVKAGLFSALETGASQIRRRFFIVAHADEIPLHQPDGDRTFGRRAEVPQRPDTDRKAGGLGQGGKGLDPNLVADQGMRGRADAAFQLPVFPPAPFEFERWAEVLTRRPDLQPELFGLDDGLADRMDRSDAAGNGVVPLAAAYAWRTLKAAFTGD